jgi:hypothetical protein
MAPKILDEAGNEVYGSRLVDRKWAVEQGMVGYSKVLSEAKTNKRVAPSPLLVNAVKASGANKSDVVISNSDAQNLQQALANSSILDQAKVVIIVD